MYTKNLAEVDDSLIEKVGGKAASLGQLVRAGFSVPSGFVITTELNQKEHLTKEVKDVILKRFDELGASKVAVRSSAVSEDSSTDSWAGQMESYLNVDRDHLIARVEDCWHSAASARAKSYSKKKDILDANNTVAVIVQAMVDSEVAGVVFTANPITNNLQQVVIEASQGLGENVVQGEVNPESVYVNKSSLNVESRELAKGEKEILSEENTKSLASLAIEIEKLYKKPMDIEWAQSGNKLHILQARPITTLGENQLKTKVNKSEVKVIAEGKAGSVGVASGVARVVKSLNSIKDIKKDEILVAPKTTPDYVEAFTKVKGIVTDIGGATSHAAIVARELGIPAVVGANNATKVIKTGDLVTVDGFDGKVYEGEVKGLSKDISQEPYDIKVTSNEIDNLLNSITGVFVDVRDLWPMPPANLFAYFDVDQSLSIYNKLKQLIDDGVSFKEIAKLFKRAEQVRYFLINTGVMSLKAAHNLKIADITIEDQVNLVKWCIEILKELTYEDPLCLKGKNIYMSPPEVERFVSKYIWQPVTRENQEIVEKLSINLYSLNWSFYWNYYGAAGYDIHGPYSDKKFGDSQVIVKDFFNIAPSELWPVAKKIPFKSVVLAQVYESKDIKISFGNRIVNQGELAGNNTHFVLIVDGKQITDANEMQKIASMAAELTKLQTDYVNSMDKMDVARMCAKLAFYIHKDFYLHFGKDWYPEADIESTIKHLGRKFVDREAPKQDRSIEFKRNMLDPRNYVAP